MSGQLGQLVQIVQIVQIVQFHFALLSSCIRLIAINPSPYYLNIMILETNPSIKPPFFFTATAISSKELKRIHKTFSEVFSYPVYSLSDPVRSLEAFPSKESALIMKFREKDRNQICGVNRSSDMNENQNAAMPHVFDSSI